MAEKVLVVDDERDIADLLEVYLRNENYDVYKYYSAKEALECIENQEIDLAILDIMLPDINGFSLCQKIREKYTYPIIMLTAKDEETDKITGLTLGADDYVTKPFRPLELIARVKAQLRRYKKYTPVQIEKHSTPKLTYKKLMLDTQTYIMVPTNGAIYYDGQDIHEMGKAYRELFGFLPQDFGYSRDFTVKDYLEYMAALKDVPARETSRKINHLLDILTLSDVKRKKIAKLSGGMKRRVGIAQAMLNDPKILVMDEPTAGLDPGERVRFRNFISEFSHDRIVLISTHIVSDVEYIATRNAIMKDGKIVDVGTTDELVKQIEGKVWTCTIPARDLDKYEMRLRIINQRGEDNNQVSIRYLSDKSEIEGSITISPRLEDLYLWLFPQADLSKEGN